MNIFNWPEPNKPEKITLEDMRETATESKSLFRECINKKHILLGIFEKKRWIEGFKTRSQQN